MKVIVAAFSLVVALAHPAAKAVESKGVGPLLTSLTELRDTCSTQAKEAGSANRVQEFKLSLDDRAAVDKARSDARVYSVGHSDRQAAAYFEDRVAEERRKVDADRKQLEVKRADDNAKVAQCISDAEQKGKAEYSAFKTKHKSKDDLASAESLMAAWLTNLKEITTDKPTGSESTDSAWKTAKSHAELAAL